MAPDLWTLYREMLRSRLFELAVEQLWNDGDISGEMHLGTGEEAIAAGMVSQLIEAEGMALDHHAVWRRRPSPTSRVSSRPRGSSWRTGWHRSPL